MINQIIDEAFRQWGPDGYATLGIAYDIRSGHAKKLDRDGYKMDQPKEWTYGDDKLSFQLYSSGDFGFYIMRVHAEGSEYAYCIPGKTSKPDVFEQCTIALRESPTAVHNVLAKALIHAFVNN